MVSLQTEDNVLSWCQQRLKTTFDHGVSATEVSSQLVLLSTEGHVRIRYIQNPSNKICTVRHTSLQTTAKTFLVKSVQFDTQVFKQQLNSANKICPVRYTSLQTTAKTLLIKSVQLDTQVFKQQLNSANKICPVRYTSSNNG